MNPRANADLAIRFWSDPALEAWHWQSDSQQWRLCAHPDFHAGTTWHVGHEAPIEPPLRMCELAGIKFPMPMTKAPEERGLFWHVSMWGVRQDEWADTAIDRGRLARGLCHKTKGAAEQHHSALAAANMQAIEGAK